MLIIIELSRQSQLTFFFFFFKWVDFVMKQIRFGWFTDKPNPKIMESLKRIKRTYLKIIPN